MFILCVHAHNGMGAHDMWLCDIHVAAQKHSQNENHHFSYVIHVSWNCHFNASKVDDKGPALSTRSQKPIVDKEWEDLESDLLMVAPVIEPEIYDVLNPDLDEDYTDFLTSLYKGVWFRIMCTNRIGSKFLPLVFSGSLIDNE